MVLEDYFDFLSRAVTLTEGDTRRRRSSMSRIHYLLDENVDSY